MITNTYSPHVGGVARSVQTFTEEFRGAGHRVLVVAPTFPGLDPTVPELDLVRIPAIQQFNGSDFSVQLPMTALLNGTIEDFPAQIVHSHHPYLLGDTALRIAATKHVPIVFTHHTRYEEYTHYVPLDSPALKQFTIELSTQYANLCDAVIAPSESIAQLLRERGVHAPLAVIPTGIDLGLFSGGDSRAFRQEHGIPADRFVVGHVGRLALEKNLRFLVRSVAAFLRGTRNSMFLVVGKGPETEFICAVFEELNLTHRMLLAGEKTGRELANAYAAMDAFVFSSKSETQGLVLAEAMAAGVPVVALNASGTREIVEDGINGRLLPEMASEAEFTQVLKQFKARTRFRLKCAQAARRTAENWSKEVCARKLIDYYEAVRQQTRSERQKAKEDLWAALLKRIEVEWGLIAEKARAVVTALKSAATSEAEVPAAKTDDAAHEAG
ncbi:MAG: glycosyltransferase [Verrucomicrobiota bacterium]